MPPRPRRFSAPRRSTPRRRVIWAEFDAVINMTANAQWITLDMLQTFKASIGSEVTKATVVRTHFSLVPLAFVAGDRFWTGIKVYDLDDITSATTTSAFVPNPHDNPYVDWAWMSRHTGDAVGGLHPGGSPGMPNNGGVDVDLKSRRRLNNVQETWGFCLYQDNVTTIAKSYHLFARSLLALA